MKAHNEKKAKILYDFLDSSELFKGTVVKEDRSLMNVPFVTGDADLDAKFVKEATEAGFVNLKDVYNRQAVHLLSINRCTYDISFSRIDCLHISLGIDRSNALI